MKALNNRSQKISAVVIVKNEEAKIADCLESLEWCDEIIVVDNGSIDRTVEIAKGYGVKVVEAKEKIGFSGLRNLGLKKANADWVLYVDADERVGPGLRSEIQTLVTSYQSPPACPTYVIPRRNIILGKELKHGGWWPDYVKRLFFKKALEGWTGELHEEPNFKGKLGYLKNPLIHLKHDNFSDMITKTNRWSEIEARLMFETNHPKMNVFRFISAMAREFWLRMIKKRAFLDGTEGIIYAIYQMYSRFISYAKLWELQLKELDSSNTN